MRFAGRIGSAALLAAIAIALPALNTAAEPDSQAAVRISGAAYLGDLPTVVAEERGFFAASGLEAEVRYSNSGKQNLARLRAGDTNFALMALTPMVLDRLADSNPAGPNDPVILANLLHSSELMQILASTASGIERPADLEGRRIGFERGTNAEFLWWLFEEFHGIDRSSIQPVSVPFSEMADALLAGQLDAAVLPEPWASRLQARVKLSGNKPLRRFDTSNLYSGKWVLVTTRRQVLERGETCRKVLAAYRQAIEFIELQPNEAIAIYQRRVELADRVPAERWDALDYVLNLDWTLIAGLQEQFRWAQQAGYANVGGPVRVLELIEFGPLYESWPDAVHLPAVAARGQTP